jgi:hypothetical protein
MGGPSGRTPGTLAGEAANRKEWVGGGWPDVPAGADRPALKMAWAQPGVLTVVSRRRRPQRSGRNNKKPPDRRMPIRGLPIGTAGWSCVGLTPSSLVSADNTVGAKRSAAPAASAQTGESVSLRSPLRQFSPIRPTKKNPQRQMSLRAFHRDGRMCLRAQITRPLKWPGTPWEGVLPEWSAASSAIRP